MNEINNKELIERVAKLADKIEDAMDGEHTVVCMSALAYETAMMLVSHTDTQIATVEVGDLLATLRRKLPNATKQSTALISMATKVNILFIVSC